MHDADRAAMTRFLYQRLADPRFRRRLTAATPDGMRPMIVALRHDTMRELIDKLSKAGGAANVAVPTLNGFIVVAMTEARTDAPTHEPASQLLTTDCTVGVFVARLHLDGGEATYGFDCGGQPSIDSGRAEVVALGG